MPNQTLIVNKKTNMLADTPESIYTAPGSGKGTVINTLTAANNSTSNKSYKAYIVGSDETEVQNPQQPFRIVLWDDIDAGSGVAGQTIPPGGSLYVECNAPESVYFTVSGTEN